tara:strand:- start:124 stop:507 length:384 start_codon:yes stop_codon:yes gene_type:complete
MLETVKLNVISSLLKFNVKIGRKLTLYQAIYDTQGEVEEMGKSEDFDLRGLSNRVKNVLIHDQDVIDKRWAICQECEFLTEKNRCKKCGCFMKKKTKVATVGCPIGKWGKEYDFIKGRSLNGINTTT